MDQAKAIINLKEGTVQLEGPVEFVREYLDRFAARELPGRRRKAEISPKAAVERGQKRVRRARGRRAGRIPPAGAIRAESEAGFFNEPRAIPQIRQRLADKGISFSVNSIRVGLRQAVESGLLSRTGVGRALRYQHSSKSNDQGVAGL